jgi:hypothetical protein
LAKYIAANQNAFAQKLRSDYARSQQADPGSSEGPDLRAAHAAERETGVRSGLGVGPRVSTTGVTGTAANDDGTDLVSPTNGVIESASKSDVYKRVVKTLMSEGLSADAAWSAVHRHERKESIGW